MRRWGTDRASGRQRGVYRTVAGFLMLGLGSGCGTMSGDGAVSDGLQRCEFVQRAMGVEFRIVVYAPDAERAGAAARAAFARVNGLDAALSDYDLQSELSRLSRAAVDRWTVVGDDLWRVLELARGVSAASGGAFDVTVGPAAVLWRRARRQGALPTDEHLARARAAIGWRKVELDAVQRAVKLGASGMRLDLGGIAKGYAAQCALDVLRSHGLRRALVDAGGDLVVGDPPPGADGWVIALLPMAAGAAPREAIVVAGSAVATSGDLFRWVEIDGVRYAHIVDPRTGLGLTSRCAATVVAPDGALADALASAACVLGPERAVEVVGGFAGAAVLAWREEAGAVRSAVSPGFPERIGRDEVR